MLAVVLLVGTLLLLTDVTRAGPLTSVDREVADGLHEWFARRPWAARAAGTVTFVGSSAFGVPVVLGLVAWCLRHRALRSALFALLTTAGGKVLERTLKVVVGRERPTWNDPLATAADYSFPSGHAMGVTLVVGVLAVLLASRVPARWRRPLLAVGAGWALLVAFSRIALGVHYLTDVVAGMLLGGAWLAATAALLVPSRAGCPGAGDLPSGGLVVSRVRAVVCRPGRAQPRPTRRSASGGRAATARRRPERPPS